MVTVFEDTITIQIAKQELESMLDYEITPEIFDKLKEEMSGEDCTFMDMLIGICDVTLEEIRADQSCYDPQ